MIWSKINGFLPGQIQTKARHSKGFQWLESLSIKQQYIKLNTKQKGQKAGSSTSYEPKGENMAFILVSRGGGQNSLRPCGLVMDSDSDKILQMINLVVQRTIKMFPGVLRVCYPCFDRH